MSTHLKLHALTGNTDHVLSGLASNQIIYVQDQINGVQSTGIFTDGSGSLTATSITSTSLSATTLSGGTILSGSTNLYSIFLTSGQLSGTTVIAGSNTNVSSTGSTYQVSVVASPSFNALTLSGAGQFAAVTATSFSGGTLSDGTIFSGSTNLYSIFAAAGSGVQSVQPGTNVTIAGTATNPIVNLTASPSVNGLSVSGTGNFTGTLQSGGTDLNNIFIQGSGTSGTIPVWNGTRLQGNSVITQTGTGVTVNGSIYIYGNVDVLGTASTFNTQTIQTADNNITMNLSGSHVSAFGGGITVLSGTPNNVASTWTIDANGAWSSNTQIFTSAITVNGGAIASTGGGTITSGGTNLYSIFATAGLGVQAVQPGTNITTGGTTALPVINLTASPSVNNITFSGTAIGGTVQAGAGTFTSISGGTLSGGTILSGSTNLYSIFAAADSGINTASNGLTKTVNNVTLGGALTAATAVVMGGNALQLSGEGASSATVAWSGAPYYTRLLVNGSGSQLKTTFGTLGNNFFLASDSVTMNYTDSGAGTNMRMVFDGTNMNVTDAINSRGLEYVADYSVNFLPNSLITKQYVTNVLATGGTVQSVQAGSNITTGGTATNPIINLAASPSVNNFTASGNTSLQGTSGTTIYASTFFQMTPYTGANPSSPNNNDAWFYSAATGIITLNYRVGGVTKSVELA